MRYVKLLVLSGALALGLLALLPAPSAEAQDQVFGCCSWLVSGTVFSIVPPTTGNTLWCSTDPTQSRRLDTGDYVIDFSAITTDVKRYFWFGSLTDPVGTSPDEGEISYSTRANQPTAVRVQTENSAGAPSERPGSLCIVKK